VKEIVFTRRFERDFRRLKTRHSHTLDYETLEYVFELLQRGASLPDAFREHRLGREYAGFFECHGRCGLAAGLSGHAQSNRLSPDGYTS
jgi:addiction module RelE/StbE family toxin